MKLDDIIDPQRLPVLWLLFGFVSSALLTRFVTRKIRARSEQRASESGGLIKDVHIGGVHVHHQVWGILMVLVVGLLLITYRPAGVALDVLAALFGVGAALALDEFAMWLHLEDVYWANEGRKSISAIMTAFVICLVLVLGSDPFDLGDTEGPTGAVIAGSVLIGLALSVLCILKGKLPLALMGIFLPLMLILGSIRLAKPDSWWARRNYDPGSRKQERSAERFGPKYQRRWERVLDLLGGVPNAPATDAPPRSAHSEAPSAPDRAT